MMKKILIGLTIILVLVVGLIWYWYFGGKQYLFYNSTASIPEAPPLTAFPEFFASTAKSP